MSVGSETQSRGSPRGCASGRSMPIRTRSRWNSLTCSAGRAEQGDRGAPGDDPAEVGDGVAVGGRRTACRARAPGRTGSRERRSTTHSPPSMRRRSSVASASAGRRQVDRSGALLVGRAHVRVVGGEGVEPGDELADEHVLVDLQRGVAQRPGGRRSTPSPTVLVARQNEPKPCVGNTSASVGDLGRRSCASSATARGPGPRSRRGRSGRGGPTLPKSSEPPVNTASVDAVDGSRRRTRGAACARGCAARARPWTSELNVEPSPTWVASNA